MGGGNRIYSFSEEFTDFILVDEKRQSVIINLECEYFKTIYREYKKYGYKLKHVTKFSEGNHMTCVFVKE